MKTSTLRKALPIALLAAATGASECSVAQDAKLDTSTKSRAPVASAAAKGKPKNAADTSPAPAPAVTNLQSMTVTGTRIRGGTTPSPIITIGSEQIQQEGFTDLGEVVRSVPQNFSGGQNPGVAVGATAGAGGIANQNVTGGSSLNLRGLGPDATLTLLNGRRLAYGGIAQAVDISAIPVEAVDRVEIVPDGASAIYGSDAVGGVGNVILKRDYEGVTVGARYGGATDGGLATHEYNVTAGGRWSTGGLIATYKDVSTDPIYARQRSYTDYMFDPTTLYPGSDLQSALVSVHQSIGDAVELQMDALQTQRRQYIYPWNTGLQPYYYRVAPDTTTTLISPELEIFLADDWTLSIAGSWGRDRHIQNQSQVDMATGAQATLIRDCYCNDAYSYEVSAEGPLFTMAGGDARLAVGAGSRSNTFDQRNYLTGTREVHGEERNRFAYAELNLPLIGSDAGVAGVRRLDLTAAVRGENYDSFGSVTTPKVGLIYGPSSDVTLKASWGKSFKAPTLFQLYQAQTAELDPASFYGGSAYGPKATVLSVWGGNPDLGAEHATTWTVSSAFHPEALPALEAELTWFDIDYTNRVVQPITDYAQALVNPNDAPFIDYAPTGQKLAAVLASANAFYNYAGKPYNPSDVAAILYAQYVNVARQHARGLDLSSSYRFDFGAGHLALRGSATWLDSTQQNTPAQDGYAVAGTLFNPAKVKGRFGAIWTQGGFTASTFADYTAGVTDHVNGRKTASFTTIDATLRYATGKDAGAFSGLEFALSAQNLLDRNPPGYLPATRDQPPYDSTNYSAIGRFVSLSVSKHW
ncbi:TonB-dependent receptor [Rhodanobacter sp. DHG33]|uniref:TonB-dependent receptor plug domain-containing protein n=1 Tax=Rhodanobacter sp. DHG33 TaxID=2775921 RepID=UPI001780158C|nr:TonB-dependent receptor [Rhodanobacter sp. DHG33]MBD8899052.1 TonB-dependent receptor [Rhodanobacter sp. DHG33]